jgi:hypothetical protein
MLLLIVMGLVEFVTGVILLASPSWFCNLLLGDGLTSPQSLFLGRTMGSALVSIGAACSLASMGEPSGRTRLVGSMVIYNLAVPILLICTATNFGIRGIAFFPACILHFGLAVWCIFCVQRR